MDLKYDVYTITNAEGSGEERKYVRLKQHEAMTASELEAAIQQRCTLTKGDVAAVFTLIQMFNLEKVEQVLSLMGSLLQE